MEPSRDKLLAGTSLPNHQNGPVERGKPGNLLHGLKKRARLPDQRGKIVSGTNHVSIIYENVGKIY